MRRAQGGTIRRLASDGGRKTEGGARQRAEQDESLLGILRRRRRRRGGRGESVGEQGRRITAKQEAHDVCERSHQNTVGCRREAGGAFENGARTLARLASMMTGRAWREAGGACEKRVDLGLLAPILRPTRKRGGCDRFFYDRSERSKARSLKKASLHLALTHTHTVFLTHRSISRSISRRYLSLHLPIRNFTDLSLTSRLRPRRRSHPSRARGRARVRRSGRAGPCT